jgi:hypothetical protein
MRESLRNLVYILFAFFVTIGFAFIMINNILDQNYLVWLVTLMGLTSIFIVSYLFIVIERKI